MILYFNEIKTISSLEDQIDYSNEGVHHDMAPEDLQNDVVR